MCMFEMKCISIRREKSVYKQLAFFYILNKKYIKFVALYS